MLELINKKYVYVFTYSSTMYMEYTPGKLLKKLENYHKAAEKILPGTPCSCEMSQAHLKYMDQGVFLESLNAVGWLFF